MKYVIVCDLDQSRFHEESGIGGYSQCVKVFNSRDEALRFAAEAIRENSPEEDFKRDDTYADVLEVFQDGLGGMEYFHLFAVDES